jgi:hypothetical protein
MTQTHKRPPGFRRYKSEKKKNSDTKRQKERRGISFAKKQRQLENRAKR